MAEHKVLIMGVDENDPLDYERAEMADLDVEFVKANPQSEGEAIELVRDADALMMRSTRRTKASRSFAPPKRRRCWRFTRMASTRSTPMSATRWASSSPTAPGCAWKRSPTRPSP